MNGKRISMVAVVISVSLAMLVAQGRRSPIYDPKTETTVKGTVEDVQQYPSSRGVGSGTHLTLKAPSGNFDVHVGPSDYVAKQGFTFAKGDEIEVTGSKVKFGGTDAILAREIKKDGKALTLRDRQGIPAWSRGRRGAR